MRKLEEIARGMAADQFERSGNEPDTKAGYIELVYPVLMPLALAAVRAMREPTGPMVAAGVHHENMGDMAGRYRAMIDEILSEEDGE